MAASITVMGSISAPWLSSRTRRSAVPPVSASTSARNENGSSSSYRHHSIAAPYLGHKYFSPHILIYFLLQVNIKSYASNNELAVMPQDRIQRLEWDRRYLSVLGVENNQLYELRLQTPENVFLEEEKDLRDVMDSFRVVKAVN
ncbi:hypothetical protein B296_00025660 [Ensete ventricosum]|uniref:PsbP C-terminal domain-containing protein n=1 Tax=Ensete ventricosum TaxID=4639 RepID=A0A426XJC1_ENSVE|nr:hypothetical protein B296_00025660 [Ensete ventricosum]